ncbi:MAG: hypothetical protein H7325_08945 [Pedobacter sp.]|nr:hypothetical protein [Pedobacter sp.]
MTINELKAYPNCDHYTDEQAENILRTLDKISGILFDYTCQQYGIVIDNKIGMQVNNNQANTLKIAA